ncbi:MAG TPA: histidine phosphatase family protein [Mycobacteriales bacterium]|nr:histidine phosphatase family protein [Mycobacteriales bacterium]
MSIPPGTTTRVHLVRHGEVHNPTKVLYGRLPGFRLSDEGVRMAERAAQWLAGRDVVLVTASPLERAQQTAAPIGAAFGLPVGIEHRVIESTNAFEGTVVDVGPGLLKHPRSWPLVRNPFKPSWGEPYEQVAARVLDAVDDVRAQAAGHEAVIVTHQLPVWVTRRRVEGRTLWHRPDRRQCSLGSITTLVYDGDTCVAVEYAEPSGPGVVAQGSVGA